MSLIDLSNNSQYDFCSLLCTIQQNANYKQIKKMAKSLIWGPLTTEKTTATKDQVDSTEQARATVNPKLQAYSRSLSNLYSRYQNICREISSSSPYRQLTWQYSTYNGKNPQAILDPSAKHSEANHQSVFWM